MDRGSGPRITTRASERWCPDVGAETGGGIPRRLRLGALRGVWWLPVDVAPETLESVGAAIEWHTVALDTGGCASKEPFLQACADAFALPSWFGMNWDALADCLTDLDVGESGGILVGWWGWRDLDQSDFEVAVDIFREASARWDEAGVSGAVVLVGQAGDPGIRSLSPEVDRSDPRR